MQYSNNDVRRQDRLLEKNEAISLLEIGEFGVLSMASSETGAYGIPFNYVWDRKLYLYFHCAPEGKKLELLKIDNRATFCVVGRTNVIAEKFSTGYESIILTGTVSHNLSVDEKRRGLELLAEKYSPGNKVGGEKYIDKLFSKTEVLRFEIKTCSGKCKKLD